MESSADMRPTRWQEGLQRRRPVGRKAGSVKNKKTALIVMRQRGKALAMVLEQCGAIVRLVRTCREARRALRGRAPVDLVFSDLSLDDGSWWTVRQELARTQSRAPLAVCLPRAGGASTAMLDSGCFAVLAPPYRREAIRAIIDCAAARRSI